MKKHNNNEIRDAVRDHYGRAAGGRCTVPSSDSSGSPVACCGYSVLTPDETSKALGYSSDELALLPEGANLGLGCGNPQAIASIMQGETVLDLGSGHDAGNDLQGQIKC